MGSMDNHRAPALYDAEAEPIIAPIAVDVLESELKNLSDYLLIEQGDYRVYCAPTNAMPSMMREIGRVREESFRDVGEGSGRSCDIDQFDAHYHQLFVWHKTNRDLVGAYRLGLVDELVEEGGIDALYSTSLFKYDEAFCKQLRQIH
ncbi:GNAT family N-acetyltransferase [Vibrio sinaloensis]|nr:GNAT family N-acetyltransferase [Vibrio sinaloensis]